MSILSSFAQLDRKFAWSFLGFVLAAVFGGIAIYTEFIRDDSPVITYEILNNTKILDVKEDVGGLSIIYNNEDIRKSKKTLSVLTVKISNDGRSPILKTYYDNASPLGLTLNSGDIIKGEIVNATTTYLQENAKLKITGPLTAEFSDVIIEPNESFIAKFLVLNPESAALAVTPKGKVASVKKITIIDQFTKPKKQSFLIEAYSGTFLVQLARLPSYFIGFILSLAIVFGPIAIISEKLEKRKRRKVINQFSSYSEGTYDAENKKIYDFYTEHGLSILLRIKNATASDERFSKLIQSYKKSGEDSEKPDDEIYDPAVQLAIGTLPHERRRGISPSFLIKRLLLFEIISRQGEDFVKNEEKFKAMEEFVDFAVIKEA